MAEISREEAIEKIKQTPMYRYECELEEDSQSDLCKALCKAISDMEKLEKIEKIIKKYDLQDITCDDVDDIVSGFEYEIIMAVLGKDIEV